MTSLTARPSFIVKNLRILAARLASSMWLWYFALFYYILVWVSFQFVCSSVSESPWISCVVVIPPAGHRNADSYQYILLENNCFSSGFLLSSFQLFFLFFLVVFVVSSLCWSITWTYRRTDRSSKQQHCPLGTRPAPRVHDDFVFFFFHSLFSFDSLPVSGLLCPFLPPFPPLLRIIVLFNPIGRVWVYVPAVISL